MKKQTVLKGAFILSTVGLFNRLLGFVLRVILVKIIGDEGLGIFQMVYPLYITLLLISTAGFPLAIAKLIPEKDSNHRKGYAFYLFRLTTFSVIFTAGITVFFTINNANYIATKIFSDSRTYYTILILAPALFITTIASILRSFFQGFQNMIPTAISQLTEQLTRFTATIVIISITASLQLTYQAAGVAAGILFGELAGLLFLTIYFIFWYYKEKTAVNSFTIKESLMQTYKKIAVIALPITGGRILNSLIRSFEAVLIPSQLILSGLNRSEATALFGQLTGMVEQIIFLPAVITTGLTISLIPAISKYFARDNLMQIRKNYNDILRIISYMGLPAAFLFYLYGSEICQILFGYPEAGQILKSLAFASPFIYYLQVSSGMLNGLGKPHIAVINVTVGSGVKIYLIYLLVSSPDWRIKGAASAAFLGYIIASFLNYFSIKFIIKNNFNFISLLVKPIFSILILFLLKDIIIQFSYNLPAFNIVGGNTIWVLFISFAIYIILMFLIRAITIEDIKRFS